MHSEQVRNGARLACMSGFLSICIVQGRLDVDVRNEHRSRSVCGMPTYQCGSRSTRQCGSSLTVRLCGGCQQRASIATGIGSTTVLCIRIGCTVSVHVR